MSVSRILLVCLSLSLCSAASSLSCRWMELKFRQHSEICISLLNTMANNSTNSTEDAEVEDTVAFPHHLYSQASKASAADKLRFLAQVLEEMVSLLEEDHSAASWEEKTVENFQNVASRQASNLRSCTGSDKKNKKLQAYFEGLTSQILEPKGHSAEAWELIRREMKTHLMRAELLAASLLNN